jgi:predicted permease
MREGLARIRTLPGVVAAGATYFVPLEVAIGAGFRIIGKPPEPRPLAGWAPVSDGYFEAFRVPLERGRTFRASDTASSPPVVVINQSMAKQYWEGADPLRNRIVIGESNLQFFRGEMPRQIVGIVGDVRDTVLNRDPRPTMYVPQAQAPDGVNAILVRIQPVAWIVRTESEPRALVPGIREQLRQATGLPVAGLRSMTEVVSLATARQRFNMLLMTVFGSAALLLAAVGIYGLMAYSVAQRTQEIGIRLALGADAVQMRRMVIRQGVALALAGVVVGLGAAWGLSRFLESFLFGVKARDPLVFVAVPALLGLVAFLAVSLPAVRASRIDPIAAIRYE